jgi:nitrogenase molybdenum-iron protein NifN
LPVIRIGFPQYDLIGGFQRHWIGYQGTKQVLFDLANILLTSSKHEVKPYHSIYAQKPEYRQEGGSDGDKTASENCG